MKKGFIGIIKSANVIVGKKIVKIKIRYSIPLYANVFAKRKIASLISSLMKIYVNVSVRMYRNVLLISIMILKNASVNV